MKLSWIFLLFPFVANAQSYLVAQSFPKTFSDLSFTERMRVLRDGYEPFESVYDADGRCISGCAFTGMYLEDTKEFYRQQTDAANIRADILRAAHPEWNTPAPPVQSAPTTNTVADTALQTANTAPNVVSFPRATSYQGLARCPVTTPFNNSIPATVTVPTQYPISGSIYITSGYGPRAAPATKNGRRGTSYHYGVDFRAPTGTPVFSTISGTVISAGNAGDCGKFVKIRGADGFSVGYCHLDKILVKVGDAVSGGCVIGLVGNTGNSGGAHLHYIVYNSNNAQICPEKYLPTSQNTSPVRVCN